MPEFIVRAAVTYRVVAETGARAREIIELDTEHPVFPTTVGACVYDEVVSVEEVK